jgi:periplasmic copper chaperone A
MRKFIGVVLGVAVLVSPARAGMLNQGAQTGSISVEQPWSPATGGAQVGVGYLTIKNDGDTDDRLVSVTAEIAGTTEVHQMSMADGVMKMRRLTEGLTVPAHGSVVLDANSYHLMFIDLKRQPKAGEQFNGTLTFEKAGTIDVTFDVEGVGATSPQPTEHNHQ